MENFVVSKDLAEKLKEAGFPQYNCEFYWTLPNPADPSYVPFVVDAHGSEMYEQSRKAAAPLSDEILVQLPKGVVMGTYTNPPQVVTEYRRGDIRGYGRSQELRPSDALAELWLFCKANNYLEKE
jgi:hypothetical protein